MCGGGGGGGGGVRRLSAIPKCIARAVVWADIVTITQWWSVEES